MKSQMLGLNLLPGFSRWLLQVASEQGCTILDLFSHAAGDSTDGKVGIGSRTEVDQVSCAA
jgi:hypothetical protein